MTKFNQCPNCEEKPREKVWGTEVMTIYKCKKCEMLYCHECEDNGCPKCGSESRVSFGKCYSE